MQFTMSLQCFGWCLITTVEIVIKCCLIVFNDHSVDIILLKMWQKCSYDFSFLFRAYGPSLFYQHFMKSNEIPINSNVLIKTACSYSLKKITSSVVSCLYLRKWKRFVGQQLTGTVFGEKLILTLSLPASWKCEVFSLTKELMTFNRFFLPVF